MTFFFLWFKIDFVVVEWNIHCGDVYRGTLSRLYAMLPAAFLEAQTKKLKRWKIEIFQIVMFTFWISTLEIYLRREKKFNSEERIFCFGRRMNWKWIFNSILKPKLSFFCSLPESYVANSRLFHSFCLV